MATRNIQTKVSLDGEKEYKRALSEINSGMKVLKSEMELTSAQFSDNADSMEALTKKGDILERQISTQKEKIEQLKEALKGSADAYGESDKRTMNYQTSLNKAETELIELNKELDNNKEAMEKAGDATEEGAEKFSLFKGESQGLGDVLNGVAGKFGVNLPEGMTKSLNGILKINPKVAALTGVFVAAAAAIVKAEKALMEWTKESAAFADEVLTSSVVSGLSPETLQEWSYAAELMDVSLDTVTGSMTKLIRSMNDARNGTGKAKDTFKELGIEITNVDGSLRDSEDVFWDTINALGNIENATDRDAISMEIFGKSAQDLNPLILQGRDGFEALASEAHEAGAVLDGEALAALGAVDDAQQRLLQTQEAVTKQISAEYAPHMETALKNTTDFVSDLGKAVIDSGVVDSLGELTEHVTYILEPLGELIGDILPPLVTLLQNVGDALKFIDSFVSPLTSFTNLLVDKFKADKAIRLGETLYGNVYNPTTGLWEGAGSQDYQNYERKRAEYEADKARKQDEFEKARRNSGYNASGTHNFRGGVTWVGEAGPERVILPAGSQIQSAQESRKSGTAIYVGKLVLEASKIKDLEDIVYMVKNKVGIDRMGGLA